MARLGFLLVQLGLSQDFGVGFDRDDFGLSPPRGDDLVGRPKDLELCQTLLDRGCVTDTALRARVDATPLGEREMKAVYRRLREVISK